MNWTDIFIRRPVLSLVVSAIVLVFIIPDFSHFEFGICMIFNRGNETFNPVYFSVLYVTGGTVLLSGVAPPALVVFLVGRGATWTIVSRWLRFLRPLSR
jgi:hypothetical protein